MGLTETIYASGKVVSIILVPVLRELAAVLLAFAISKDCKARDNGSGILWGIFTLIAPIFSGVVYLIYSRFLVKRNAKSLEAKKKIKIARRLTIAAVSIYVLSFIIAVVAFVTNIASGIALHSGDDSKGVFSALLEEEELYDRNGIRYDNEEEVPVYDQDGNEYHYVKSPNGINNYTYFDENDNEYDMQYCYISKDGYFYYDKNDLLEDSKDLFYYDKHFYDSSGNEYAHIDDYVFWDKEGNIRIQYLGNRCRNAFD